MLKSILILLFLISIPARASVVAYDNLNHDGGLPYGLSGDWIGTLSHETIHDTFTLAGSSFVPTVSGILDSFDVGITELTHNPSSGPFTWSIHAADGVSPDLGEALWTQQYVQEFGNFETIASFSTDSGPMLNQGQAYWLVIDVPIDGSASLSWAVNDTGATGDRRGEYHWNRPDFNRIDIFFKQGVDSYAMAVNVNPVPVPAAAWLFGSALLGLGAIKRKKNSRKALSC